MTSDSWYDRAACQGEDPREWDEGGTDHAQYVCRVICPVRAECLTAARIEQPVGQMRAGIHFPTPHLKAAHRPLVQRYSEHEAWHQMWLSGISYSEIGRRVGRAHSTVMDAVRRIEKVAS